MNVNWLEHTDSKKIFMNQSVLNRLNLKENQLIPVTFGTLKINKKILINNELHDDMIGLSPHLTEDIQFPREVIYDVLIKDDEINIGPLIGMLVTKDHQKLTPKRLEIAKERIPSYESVKGVIFVGCHDWIDIPKKLIKGFYYTRKGEWKKGIFPFPTALYNRAYIKSENFMKLTKKVNMHVFNNCLMTKSKLWKLLCKEPSVNHHLPFTQTLKDVNSFLVMIEHFKTVYLKPTNLSRGRGIIQATKEKIGYRVKGSNNQEQFLFTKQEIEQFISSLSEKHNYLVQQGVPYKYGRSLIDFRVICKRTKQKSGILQGFMGVFQSQIE